MFKFLPPALIPYRVCTDAASLQLWWKTQYNSADLLQISDSRKFWRLDIEDLPMDVRHSLEPEPDWHWVVYPWLRSATLVPDADTTYAVLTSRNYPIITRGEQQALKNCYVILLGLSTGRAVAQQLARLGVGHLRLVDGDHVAPANTNRLVGTRLTDLGLSKVLSTARELWEFNPHLKVDVNEEFLDEQGLSELCSEERPDVIVEMIDGLQAKIPIRRVARAHSIPVVMPIDMDWDPVVDIDLPGRPMFGGRLSDADLVAAESGTPTLKEKTELAMRLMALERWAPRSALSGQLARHGLVNFWSQTIPSVAVGAALASRAVLDLIRKSPPAATRIGLSVRDAFRTPDPVDMDEPLVQELMRVDPQSQLPDGHGW